MLTKLLDKDPKNKTAWNNKGLALGKFGRVYEAIDCYDKALEIAPRDPVVLNNKGSALFKKGVSARRWSVIEQHLRKTQIARLL